MKKITIAGASGFIGSELLEVLKHDKELQIRALSRKHRISSVDNTTWQPCDLYSLTSTVDAFKDTHTAIFLVHSMLPATNLFQGSFRDTDLIIADNFARACIENNVQRIIYLGGVIPSGKSSIHLESRKEVEEIILSTNIDCKIIRAGMVVGNGGSSYEILKKLCSNLPAMILPKWTNTKTQIIYIKDLVSIIANIVKSNVISDEIINAVSGEVITYSTLIKKTCKHLKKKTLFINFPINYTKFSKLWVTIFGESNYELVSPLIDSLLCDISKIKTTDSIKPFVKYTKYDDMLIEIDSKTVKKANQKNVLHDKSVRSIQRLSIDKYHNINDVAQLYFNWLPEQMKYLITVKRDKNSVNFYMATITTPLLMLDFINTSTHKDRVKFHITGGLLSSTDDTGWLEFRNVNNGKYLLASINEFKPALPWFIYKFTQALIHKKVMDDFSKKLNNS